MPTAATNRVRPGRPRHHAADQERRLLYDAAFELMQRNGYDGVTVADVLAAAGLGTRSFYRHFASKADLLNAMFRRDALTFAADLEAQVAAAPTAEAAVFRWVEEILSLGLGGPRSQRAAVLGSTAAMQSIASAELERSRGLIAAPLTAALTQGKRDGSFADTINPPHDAELIYAVALDTAERIKSLTSKRKQAALRATTLAFLRRALRLTSDG